MKTIKFEKWQGLGNDFVILTEEKATPELAKIMCDRNFGIGADGLFSPKKTLNTDIGWDFYNSDGSVAQMCGNGIRCFAKFVREHNLVNKDEFSVETLAGTIIPSILEDGRVRVDMGMPILDAKKYLLMFQHRRTLKSKVLEQARLAWAIRTVLFLPMATVKNLRANLDQKLSPINFSRKKQM